MGFSDSVTHPLRGLSKISKGGVRAVLLAIYIVSAGVQNVHAKSILVSAPSTEGTTSASNASSSTTSASTPESTEMTPSLPPPESEAEEYYLNELTPDHTLHLYSSNSTTIQFKLGGNENVTGRFRIAVHLKDCSFSSTESIHLKAGNISRDWGCSKEEARESNESEEDHPFNIRHLGEDYVKIDLVWDGLEEVRITPNFTPKYHGKKEKAIIIVSIYQDVSDGCPAKYFDCHQPLCPSRCCSDYATGSGAPHHNSKQSLSLTSGIFSRRSVKQSRCIHESLVCDGNPNCGHVINSDETNEVCHAELYCPCQTLCLTWNYVLTSLAIAVLFIITTTAIVFVLFHRRNVALERARLIRLANARMADMRGEFTRDDMPNDLPPSYDDVYDIKEPPPCFCQAVGMQTQQSGNGEENLDTCICRPDAKQEGNGSESSSSNQVRENNTEVGVDAVNAINKL